MIIIFHSTTNPKYLLYNFKNETANLRQRQNEAILDVENVIGTNRGVTGQYIFIITVSEQLKSELHGCNSDVTVLFRYCQKLIFGKQMSGIVL